MVQIEVFDTDGQLSTHDSLNIPSWDIETLVSGWGEVRIWFGWSGKHCARVALDAKTARVLLDKLKEAGV